jgi:hypothetical protein
VAFGAGLTVFVVVGAGGGGGGEVVVGRGLLLPHETRAQAVPITPMAATLLRVAALSAEMTPKIDEEA